MSDLERHLEVAARCAIRYAFEAWSEDGWESLFPDVGQYDYEEIIETAEKLLTGDVTTEEFGAAYEFLSARAETGVPL